MKFLIIHNQYSRRGGEESVVELQRDLLISHGHTVIEYSRSHSEVGAAMRFVTAIYNRRSVRDIRRIVQSENPDVAIIHNLFPVISAAVLAVLKKSGIRVLMTLHNYRLACPNGLFYTNGKPCEQCGIKGSVIPCITNRCQGTLLGSISWAARTFCAAPLFCKYVDKFMALSHFQKNIITKYTDIEPNKFEIVPNCIQPLPIPNIERQDYVAFVGRLSVEKGVDLLFETARLLPDTRFKVAGECAENTTIDNIPPNVELVGYLNREQLAEFYCAARCFVLTSSCYEGFPLTVIEAMYYRTTVIVPRWASLPDIVANGRAGALYTPNSAHDLALRITENHQTGQQAHKRVMEKYGSEQYYNNIMRCV